MIKMILKYVFLLILIFIDFIIYFLPVCILCLIPNLIFTLIWYFPSMYQLYSFIFTSKEYELRERIYLFLVSPIIVFLYIPSCIILFIEYSIFVTLISPLVTMMKRPEYPPHSLSSIALLVYSTYQHICDNDDEEFFMDIQIFKPFHEVIHFTRNWLHFNSNEISKKILQCKFYINEMKFYKFLTILDSFTLFLIFIFIMIPYLIIMNVILNLLLLLFSPFEIIYENHQERTSKLSSTNKFYYYKLMFYILLYSLHWMILFIIHAVCNFMNGIFWIIFVMIYMVSKTFEIYKISGFYNVVCFFKRIIVKLLLIITDLHLNINLDELLYVCLGIDVIEYRKNLSDQDHILLFFSY